MEAKGKDAWKPVNRQRVVSAALRAYAAMTTSADTRRGARCRRVERRAKPPLRPAHPDSRPSAGCLS